MTARLLLCTALLCSLLHLGFSFPSNNPRNSGAGRRAGRPMERELLLESALKTARSDPRPMPARNVAHLVGRRQSEDDADKYGRCIPVTIVW